jgi:transposase
MARRKKDPLRALTQEEKSFLEKLSRSRSAPADQIARATGILAVASGKSYGEAALLCHRLQGTTIARWVTRFNQEGLAALVPEHGGGNIPRFTGEVKARILAEFTRSPDPETDGTAVWSVSTLQKALARQDIPISISIYSLWGLLREEGYTFQKDRSWCHTGEAKRKRHRKGHTFVETVIDPDAAAKKS